MKDVPVGLWVFVWLVVETVVVICSIPWIQTRSQAASGGGFMLKYATIRGVGKVTSVSEKVKILIDSWRLLSPITGPFCTEGWSKCGQFAFCLIRNEEVPLILLECHTPCVLIKGNVCTLVLSNESMCIINFQGLCWKLEIAAFWCLFMNPLPPHIPSHLLPLTHARMHAHVQPSLASLSWPLATLLEIGLQTRQSPELDIQKWAWPHVSALRCWMMLSDSAWL